MWQERIYLGHGNSSNNSPGSNAGPIDVIYFDPGTEQFVTEYRVDEEQIDRFRVLDGKLYIPGHDPRDSWDYGNFYVREESGWRKVRTIPGAIHTYDIQLFQDTLFAAIGAEGGGAVAKSGDGGESWLIIEVPSVHRMFELFEFQSQLFGYGYSPKGNLVRYTTLGFFLSLSSPFEPSSAVDRFDGLAQSVDAMFVRVANFGSQLLYIGADNVNDHQWIPFAAYSAASLDLPRRVDLPPGFIPYDIIVRDDHAYLLANRALAGLGHEASVFETSDANTWREVVRVVLPTFARSFERLHSRYYMGLGTHASEKPLPSESGDIYEIVPCTTPVETVVAQEIVDELPPVELERSFPNPFNSNTTISYQLTGSQLTRLTVYDMAGQAVRRLINEVQGPGHFTVSWDGRDHSGEEAGSSVYVVMLETHEGLRSRKILLIR